MCSVQRQGFWGESLLLRSVLKIRFKKNKVGICFAPMLQLLRCAAAIKNPETLNPELFFKL